MRKWFWITILSLAFGSAILSAQNSNATISGRITDPMLAAIPGVSLTLYDIDHGGQRTTVTDENGVFQFSGLMPGIYNLRVEAKGFAKYDRTQMTIAAGQDLKLEIALPLKGTTEYVGLFGDPFHLQADEAKISRIFHKEEMNDVPVQAGESGREYIAQAATSPGVAMISQQGMQLAVNGQRPVNNGYWLDGINFTDSYNGRSLGISLIGNEAIQEMEFLTHNFKAVSGQNSGGMVRLVSRSGSQPAHGSVYEYHNNSALAARNFFDTAKPVHHSNLAGFTLGAPIRRDKIFLFGQYEINRGRGTAPIYFQGLTESERAQAVPEIRSLVALFPRSPSPDQRQFSLVARNKTDQSTLAFHGDIIITEKQHVTMLFNRSALQRDAHGVGNLFTREYFNQRQIWSAGVQHVYSITPTVLTETGLGFSRWLALPKAAFPVDAGSLRLTIDPRINGVFGLVRAVGLNTIGVPAVFSENRIQNKFQVSENVRWIHGAQDFTFGSLIHRVQINDKSDDNSFLGQLTFDSIRNFLVGKPTSYARNFGNPNINLRRTEWHSFLQHDWKLSSNLYMNFGLRYELNTAPREVENRIATNYLIPTDINNFAPRIGFAWSPQNNKIVVRGGYGIFYNVLEMSFLGLTRFNQSSITQTNPLLTNLLGYQPTNTPRNLVIPAANAATPFAHHWNFTIEKQFFHNSSTSVSYVGTSGHKLTRARLPNGGENLSQVLRPDPAAGVVTRLETSASSIYQALQANWSFIGYENFSFRAAYTWSKFIDDISVLPTTNIGIERNALALDENNLRLDRSVSDFHIPHVFTFSALYPLPFHRNERWLGGWKLASITTLSSGLPFTLYSGTNNLQGVNNNRINNVSGALVRNDSAFEAVRIANENSRAALIPSNLGTLGRNTERGDSYLDWNVSLTKDFLIAGEVRLQFRTEFFNVFNVTNFKDYDGILSSPNFGRALSAFDPRHMQLVARIHF